MEAKVESAAKAVRAALKTASAGLVEREALVELVALSAVAGEHLLVIGPPGTAKSEAVRRVAAALGGGYFEYLLGRFTEPSEIFGPVDLKKLKEGVVETETAGMLPEAELAFLDEVFLGSTAILNTLLGILNERMFRRGHTRMACPLRVCVGASNALPEDPSLAAFADRFLVRVFLEPLGDPRLEELLEGGWGLAGHAAPAAPLGLPQIDLLGQAARSADLSRVRPHLAHAIRKLRAAGLSLTDRRAVKVQKLVASAAVLAGRDVPDVGDLWPLVYAVPSAEGQKLARDVLRELLDASENAALSAAAAEASLGPKARAARILTHGTQVLLARPEADPAALDAWTLKLEGVAREIDAGFAAAELPPELSELRGKIVTAVGKGGPA